MSTDRPVQFSKPIENLAIGKVIEVDGLHIVAELNADLTELSRVYAGEVYTIGQFGSIIRIHFGPTHYLWVCGTSPNEGRI